MWCLCTGTLLDITRIWRYNYVFFLSFFIDCIITHVRRWSDLCHHHIIYCSELPLSEVSYIDTLNSGSQIEIRCSYVYIASPGRQPSHAKVKFPSAEEEGIQGPGKESCRRAAPHLWIRDHRTNGQAVNIAGVVTEWLLSSNRQYVVSATSMLRG
jgi:hypothetical protein